MDTIGTIAAVFGAIVATISLIYSIRNSKGNILKRIDRKEEQIRKIDHELVLKYGLNGRGIRCITPLDEKKERLQNEITELKRKL